MSYIPEQYAQAILTKAISENKASELLETLFDGGSVTLTPANELIIISSDIIQQMTEG